MLHCIAVIALLGALEARAEAAAAPSTGEGSAAKAPQPAPPSAADAIVAAAFGKSIDTPADDLKAGAAAPAAAVASPALVGGLDWTTLAAPALGLLGLAALAFAVTRRRGTRVGRIAILESATLGPRRSLVIADVLGDRLVLAVSEAGVAVLSSRPAPATEDTSAASDLLVMPAAPPAARGPGLFRRLFGRASPPRFDQELAESLEDQELRAKLAAGFRGIAP